MISSLPPSPSLPGMNRTVAIVASVVLLHLAALWALHTGLLRRLVETVVPVALLSDMVTPPAPRADTPPAPAPSTPAARKPAPRQHRPQRADAGPHRLHDVVFRVAGRLILRVNDHLAAGEARIRRRGKVHVAAELLEQLPVAQRVKQAQAVSKPAAVRK